MLLNRIRSHTSRSISQNQSKWIQARKVNSVTDPSPETIIKEIKNKNLRAPLVFIDFKRAFWHHSPWENARHANKVYGVTERLVKALIGHMYEHTITHVSSPDGVYRWLSHTSRGSPRRHSGTVPIHCSPWLCIEKGNEERLGFTLVQRKSRRIGLQVIIDKDFADDIALLADCQKDAEELVESNALKVGLGMNGKKTKAIIYNWTTVHNQDPGWQWFRNINRF